MAHMHALTFYFDPISPYAYLAFEQLPKALAGLSVNVAYKPVLFGAMLSANGQKGPAEIAGKREWTYRQVLWQAQHLGIPMAMPSAHPFNPLALLRGLLRTANARGEVNRYCAELALRHVWASSTADVGLDPNDPERLQAIGAALHQHIQQRGDTLQTLEQAKTLLRANTDEALAAGVFGVPTVVVYPDVQPALQSGQAAAAVQTTPYVFWGLDALPMLADCLRGSPWFAGASWQAMAQVPVGIARQ